MNKIKQDQVEVWAKSIEGLLLNFGTMELESCLWIGNLAGGATRDSALSTNFNERVEAVMKLIKNSGWSEDKKRQALGLWLEVKGLIKIRNTIAHNPLLSHEQAGVLQVGIINVRTINGHGPFALEPLLLDDVNRTGIRLCELFELLHRLR